MQPAFHAPGPHALRLAVVRPGALGDVLLLRPGLARLREVRPELEARVLAPGARGRLLAEGGLAASVFDLDRAEAAWLYHAQGPAPEAVAHTLGRVDRAVVFGRPTQALERALRRLGADRVIFFPARPTQGSGAPLHAAAHLWQGLAQAMDLDPRVDGPSAPAPALHGDDRGAERVLAAAGLRAGRYAVLHPGSGSRAKNAPVAVFAGLARAFLDAGRARAQLPLCPSGPVERIAVVAGEADADLGARLAAMAPSTVLLPPLDLETLAGVLARAAAYAGNDSGVTHLAAQCGAPTIALFRATDPRVWAPVGPRVAVLDESAWRAHAGG